MNLDDSIDGLKNVNRFTKGTYLLTVSQENIDQILYSNPLEHWWHKENDPAGLPKSISS